MKTGTKWALQALLGISLTLTLSQTSVLANEPIDTEKVVKIESSGNPKAYNKKSGAIGLMQVTPICLTEWNQFHPKQQFTKEQLYDPKVNRMIGEWYLCVRIPQMLRFYQKPVTVENCLIAYNAGIAYVVNGTKLPAETVQYIKKYKGV